MIDSSYNRSMFVFENKEKPSFIFFIFETFDTNVMGTAHVLNSVVSSNAANWVVVITTDKVYRNVEKLEGYAENEPLGGKDPYSASKAGTESLAACFGSAQWISNYWCESNGEQEDFICLQLWTRRGIKVNRSRNGHLCLFSMA